MLESSTMLLIGRGSTGQRKSPRVRTDLESGGVLVLVYLLVSLPEGSIVKKEVIRRIGFGLVGG
jgi:hypothetical protein